MSKIISTGLEVYGLTGDTYDLKVGYDSSNFIGFYMDSSGNWKIDPQSAPGAGEQAVTIGSNAVTTTGSSNIAIGYQADASDPGGAGQGTGGVAVGNQSTATGDASVALGTLAEATKWGGIAIGWSTSVTSPFSSSYGIGIGYNAEVTNFDGIAIGRNTLASGNGSIVIGHENSSATPLTNSTTNSLGIGWDNTTGLEFLFASSTTDSYLTSGTNGQVGFGLTSPTAKVHIRGAGSTNSTSALLVENSSGNELMRIYDSGSTVFNEDGGLHDFRVEGDVDTSLLFLNAGNDTVNIGTLAGAATSKVVIDTINESSKTTMLQLVTNVSPTGINVGVVSTTTNALGVTSRATATGGFDARAIDGVAESSTASDNYGGYFSARNATASSTGVYALSNAGTSTSTYGIQAIDASSSSSKHAGYFSVGGGQDGGTIFGVEIQANTNRDDNILYGLYSDVNVNAIYTGATIYGGYFEVDVNAGAGSTAYGIVVPEVSNKSGFGTSTPTVMLEVNGGQFKVNQYTHTMPVATATTMDFDANGNNQVIDLQPATGNVTITLTGGSAGGRYIIKTIQSSTPRTVAWDAGGDSVLWGSGFVPSATATNDAIDLWEFYYDGANYIAQQSIRDAQ
jgi:hypothetical protein